MIGFEDMPELATLDKAGKPPRERIKKASHARTVFVRVQDDDLVNAANRAEHQDLLDGGQPYVSSELTEANMSGITNLNFGGAEQKLERAMAPYYSLVQSPEDHVEVHTLYGPEDERGDIDAILSEEISRTQRESPLFSYQTLLCIQKFVKDGLGVVYFPDEDDWRYRGAGLGQFYFDRQTVPCESEQEIVFATEEYLVTRLFESIDGLEPGEESDWNPAAVKQAILKGAKDSSHYDNWERLQDELKNNDVFASRVCPPVPVVHMWIREFDGTWSHYMFTEDPVDGNDEFLYKCRQKYRSLTEAMVIFPYGLGTNGKIHGNRGLLYKIYPHEQQRNRSICRMIDQGILSSSIVLQAQDEESLSTIGLQYLGNTAVLGPEWKAVPIVMPDLQRSVMPAIELMERIGNDRVAGYSSENVFDGDQRKTKFEVSAHLEQSAELSDSALDFFYGPYERAQQQSVKRMTRRDYLAQEPGGREIMALHLRIVKRGVPLEAFFLIDHKATRVVRAIGAGSASAKTLAIARGEEMYPRMDDVGQARYNRMKAVDIWGAGNANLFFPRDNRRRTTLDTNVAILENSMLLQGEEIPVLPSDKHLAHAREHVKPLLELYDAVEANQIELPDAAVRMRLLHNHAAEHVDLVSGDPAVEEEAASLRQMMQQVGEVVVNGLKEADKLAEQAAAEGQEGGGEGPTPEQIKEAEMHRQKMQHSDEAHQQAIQQKAEKAAQDRSLADLNAAAKFARESRMQSPKTQK